MLQVDRSLRSRKVLPSYLIATLSGCLVFAASAAEFFDLKSSVIHRSEELGSSTIWTLETGKGKFTFSAPRQWQVSAKPEQKSVMMISPDAGSMINVQFTNALPELRPGGDLSKLSEAVKKRFPKAKLVEEFTCYSGSGEGRAFDLEVSDDKRVSPVRVAFVPVKDSTLEFVLQTSFDEAETTRRSLGGLMLSFEPAKETSSPK